MQVKRLGYTEISHRDKALSFTDVPARRKPIRDYAGLARVRVGYISWPEEGGEWDGRHGRQ